VTESGWLSGSCATERQWHQFAVEMASSPEMVDRLLATHLPDDAGMCTSCTTPGSGTSHVPFPCGLRRLAEEARTVQLDDARARAGRRG
jgi:hypothetical protein